MNADQLFLRSHISSQRLKPYLRRANGKEALAISMYLQDQELASAMFRDISFLEISLRNAIDELLVELYGESWHRQSATLFDERTFIHISRAWKSLPKDRQSHHPENKQVRGRIVAACTFGTWVSLLDHGGQTACKGPSDRASHDEIWRKEALLKVFPGAQRIARQEDRLELTRRWAHEQVRSVHLLRNRIAHHESLLNGVPIPGSRDPEGNNRRFSVVDGQRSILRLADMIDRQLKAFLKETSRVEELLSEYSGVVEREF